MIKIEKNRDIISVIAYIDMLIGDIFLYSGCHAYIFASMTGQVISKKYVERLFMLAVIIQTYWAWNLVIDFHPYVLNPLFALALASYTKQKYMNNKSQKNLFIMILISVLSIILDYNNIISSYLVLTVIFSGFVYFQLFYQLLVSSLTHNYCFVYAVLIIFLTRYIRRDYHFLSLSIKYALFPSILFFVKVLRCF